VLSDDEDFFVLGSFSMFYLKNVLGRLYRYGVDEGERGGRRRREGERDRSLK